MLSFVLPSRLRIEAVDSKAGSWQHAGCMLQPAWLFHRKANPPPPTKRQSIERCSVFVLRAEQKSPYQGKSEKPCQLIPALSVAARHLSQRERQVWAARKGKKFAPASRLPLGELAFAKQMTERANTQTVRIRVSLIRQIWQLHQKRAALTDCPFPRICLYYLAPA